MKNKKLFALMATLMIGTSAMGAFSGCNFGGGGGGLGGGQIVVDSQVDVTKANLSVATFDGGVGKASLSPINLKRTKFRSQRSSGLVLTRRWNLVKMSILTSRILGRFWVRMA